MQTVPANQGAQFSPQSGMRRARPPAFAQARRCAREPSPCPIPAYREWECVRGASAPQTLKNPDHPVNPDQWSPLFVRKRQ